MPLDAAADDAPTKFPTPEYLTLGKFDRGVITLIDKSHLPKNALEEATNLWLVEDGEPTIRPGVDWFGTAPILPPTTTALTGVDSNGGSMTLLGTYIYALTFTNAHGETTGGPEFTITHTGSHRSVNLTIPTGPGGTLSRKVYRTQSGGASGTETFVASVSDNTTTTYLDTAGDTTIQHNAAIPTVNTAAMGEIDGFDYFDFVGVIHLVCVADGNVMRSTNDGTTWTLCTGATLTAGNVVNMEQYNAFLYLTNGVDQITRYDGSTTLQTYTVLSTPIAPTIAETGMTGTVYTYYYQISAVSQIGFSAASPAGSIQTSQPRANWTTGSVYNTLTLPSPQSTQTRMDIYISQDNLNFYYLDSVVTTSGAPSLTYVDDGTAFIVDSTIAPVTNTTQGPTVAELRTVGLRMYGVRDPNYRNRIWFTSGTQPLGSFSSGYDGGYLDWQLGGKFLPTQVEDYRDGKGTPVATVWCNSADGQGCIIQMTLDPLSIGTSGLTVTIPTAYKLPGSRGTPAPNSVVNVLDDYFFYNTQAFYQLGSSPQLLQILSTAELSANIRPTVQEISNSAAEQIASAYFYDKVYYSVPLNSDTNNTTMIFDTERKCWLPTAFDIGFKKFLKYTDTDMDIHLLCIKPGDNRISEISTSIQGDYGVAFNTSLLTGLYQTEKDRFDFQFVEEMEFEFSQPGETIYVELLGIDHAKGFISVKTVSFTPTVTITNAGWDTIAWDTDVWDDTSIVPTVTSESSDKRYTTVQSELNAVQWHIYTNSLASAYVLRTLQTWGTNSEDAHPSGWRVSSI